MIADLEIDRVALEVRRHAARLELAPQAVSVLVVLADHRGELVSRETLYDAIWPGREVDVDRGLNTLIRQLRIGLGDSASQPRYIRTYPRRGYRLLDQPQAAPKIPAFRRRLAAAGVLLLAGAAAIAIVMHRTRDASHGDVNVDYLAGQHLLRQASVEMRARAVEPLRAAVAATPAPAVRAHLAEALFWANRLDLARAEAAAALASDSTEPHALFMAGVLTHLVDWDWSGGRHLIERALKAEPGRAEYRTALAFVLATAGERSRALVLIHDAYRRDPISATLVADAGQIALYAGEYEEAARYCALAASIEAAPASALQCAFEASLLLGDSARAGEAAGRIITLANGRLGGPVDSLGMKERVRELRERQAEAALRGDIRGRAFSVASFLAAAGRTPEALDVFERAVAAHEPMVVTAAVHPRFQSLRNDARFRAILSPVLARAALAGS